MLKKIVPIFTNLTAVVILIIADYATKMFAFAHFRTPVSIIPYYLDFSLSLNSGIAWSIPIPNSIMMFVTPVLLAGIVYLIIAERRPNVSVAVSHNKIITISISLIVAGGIGNFINRLFYGAVIDFIDFSFFPSFNMADAYLTIAVFLLILFYGKISLSKN